MLNKTPLEAALMDFVDVFDEVIFEDTCTDKMRRRAIEAYVNLRTVIAKESIATLKATIEADPDIMKAMADFPKGPDHQCGCPCGEQKASTKEPLKLPAPHELSTGKIDSIAKLDEKKAVLRKAAVTVFEGFAMGMRDYGDTSLTFCRESLVWQIHWSLTPSQAVRAGMKEPSRTRHWSWSLLPDFLESPHKSLYALYSLGRERALPLIHNDPAPIGPDDKTISDISVLDSDTGTP